MPIPAQRLSPKHRWYTLDLDFVQQHVPRLLCPPGCDHAPCRPPVIRLLVAEPRGRGRPKISPDEARVILAHAIHGLQDRGEPLTQTRVRRQAHWPSSNSKLSLWAKRLGYAHWHGLVTALKKNIEIP
jgi:hypothetical protein